MNGSLAWYSRVAWLGIAANLLLAASSLYGTESLLAQFNLPRAEPALWPQFAAVLLVLLSLLYMPAALHPQRYATIAVLTVVARRPRSSKVTVESMIPRTGFTPSTSGSGWSSPGQRGGF